MYKLLVVDDEQCEREGIEYLIQNHKIPLEVYKAKNGHEALRMFERDKNFDALLVDIMMPEMNGLQLIKKVREKDASIVIVIYSGHNEFKYAQEAIQYNVTQYLLKPIDINDFKKVFTNIIESCKKKIYEKEKDKQINELEKEKFSFELGFLLKMDLGLRSQQSGLIEECNKYFENKICIPILVNSSKSLFMNYLQSCCENLKANIKCSVWDMILNENTVLFLLMNVRSSKDRCIKAVNYLVQTMEQQHVILNIAIGESCNCLKHILDEYEKMNCLLEQFFIYDKSYVIDSNEQVLIQNTEEIPGIYLATIKSAIERKNYDEAYQKITTLFEYLAKANKQSFIYIKYISGEILNYFSNAMLDTKSFEKYLKNIYRANRLSQIRQLLEEYIELIKTDDTADGNSSNYVIKEVKNIIAQKYANPSLGLSMLADEVCLTPSYLSSLFKKKTNTKLVQYITNYRLKQAALFLENTFYKVKDISLMVGYMNQSYFTLLFNNTYGKSPVEYREEKRKINVQQNPETI